MVRRGCVLHNSNYTIDVLGAGVDICHPSEHQTLMNKIIENGAVISQFESGTTNVKQNFIKRNELITILSDKIVVEKHRKIVVHYLNLSRKSIRAYSKEGKTLDEIKSSLNIDDVKYLN